MTFLVGELVAEIRLQGKEQYTRDLQSMGQATGNLASSTSKMTSAMRTGFQATAAVITTATVAGTALGVSLFKTGAAYNTLQQTSRAALNTLLGGAEAANAQMDKLDAFARTSPFSKAVFISAQQQLIGFGMSAEKVLPTLNAIQNAVAATGGSAQSISEITTVLAQIQSAGKITATDLMQLGQRGIDAATLIGSSLGKTGPEIRESITKGTLGADEAITALTTAMQAKFGGAAANVKNTFVGATDRIKAATREIGAALAEPFISQKGGGLAVQWGNQVADVLQGVRGHAAPVVAILVGELAPAFAGITKALDHANVVVRAWDSTRLQDFLTKAQGYAPGAAALSGAIVALSTGAARAIPILGQFVPAINPLAGALIAVALASPEVRAAGMEVLNAFQPLIPVAVDLAKVLSSGLSLALPFVADGLGLVAAVARPVVQVLASIPTPVLAAVAGFLAMREALGPLTPALKQIGEQMAVQSALAAMGGNTSKLAGAFGYAGKMATGLGNSIKAAFISNPIGLIILGVSAAVGLLTSAFAAQAEKAKETAERVGGYRDTLNKTTGALTAATREQVEKNLADTEAVANAEKLGISKDTLVSAIMGEGDAVAAVSAAMDGYRGQSETIYNSHADLNRAANDLGATFDTEAAAIDAAEAATRKDIIAKREAAAAMSEAARSNQRFNDALTIARDVSKDATERVRALKSALDELNGGTKDQAELTRNLNEQTDRLREVFNATDEGGNKLAASLVSASGAIDTTTAAGRSLFDETSRLNDQMLDAIMAEDALAKARGETGISTERAAQVSQPYIDQLRTIATESGMSQQQVDGLVSTMLDTPGLVSFLVRDNGTIDEEKQALLTLAQNILATPSKNFDVSSDDFPGLVSALDALGVDITTLPAGQVRVIKDDGSFAAVDGALAQLARNRTARITVQQDGSFSVPGTSIRGSANGNLFDKGKAKAFADGGFPTGIYPGTAGSLYKFAEPETGWEAFISGRPGQESRNLAIAAEAVGRLGGMVIGPDQMRGGGGSNHTDNSLHLSMNTAPEQGTPLITQVMGLVRRLEARQARKA